MSMVQAIPLVIDCMHVYNHLVLYENIRLIFSLCRQPNDDGYWGIYLAQWVYRRLTRFLAVCMIGDNVFGIVVSTNYSKATRVISTVQSQVPYVLPGKRHEIIIRHLRARAWRLRKDVQSCNELIRIFSPARLFIIFYDRIGLPESSSKLLYTDH